MTRPTAAPDRAIGHVRARAEESREAARARIAEVLARATEAAVAGGDPVEAIGARRCSI